MSCKKCNNPKTVILRKKDFYCNDCFMINTNHKFRACIGKNKVLSPNEKVLICLSGGKGSTVLLDLIQYGISLENTKKLRVAPFFIHVFDDNQEAVAECVLRQCKNHNVNVYLVHIVEYLNPDQHLGEANSIPQSNKDASLQFQHMLNSMSTTASNDFLLKVKREMFVKYAKQLQCSFVFTAETTNTLAINLLTNLTLGRGSQVQNDVGFCDNRNEKVKIIRPMKDISKEELDYYITINQLQPICARGFSDTNSLQSVISSFVSDLQENFQSTISTVCKTADKIGAHDEKNALRKCIICESDINVNASTNLSALEATNISRTVSYGNNQFYNTTELVNSSDNDKNSAIFPLVQTHLCYGCSRNNTEMNISDLPQHVQKKLYPSY